MSLGTKNPHKHIKHLKGNNAMEVQIIERMVFARVMGNQPNKHQNQNIYRLLALDAKCMSFLHPNTHTHQTHTLGFGGGVLLFFSLWPLVGESVPVARLA